MNKSLKLKEGMAVLLKGKKEPVIIRQQGSDFFYNIIKKNEIKYMGVNLEDVEKQVWLDYNREPIEVGDYVTYIRQGWNHSSSIFVGKVLGFNSVKVSVLLVNCTEPTSLKPSNLLIVTNSKVDKKLKG